MCKTDSVLSGRPLLNPPMRTAFVEVLYHVPKRNLSKIARVPILYLVQSLFKIRPA